MKYAFLLLTFFWNNLWGLMIASAVFLAAIIPLGAKASLTEGAFVIYFILALILGVCLGIRSLDWEAVKRHYGTLFLTVTALNMLLIMTTQASPKQGMYLILMMHTYIAGSFFLGFAATSKSREPKASNVVAQPWTGVILLALTAGAAFSMLTVESWTKPVAEFMLILIR